MSSLFENIKKKLIENDYNLKKCFGSVNYIAEKKGKKIFIEVSNDRINAISFEKDKLLMIISLENKNYSILREFKFMKEEKFSALKCPKCSHEELRIYKDSIKKADIWFCENCDSYFYVDAKKEKESNAEKCKFCKTKSSYKYRFGWKVAEIIEEIIFFKCEKCNKHYFEDEDFNFLLEK